LVPSSPSTFGLPARSAPQAEYSHLTHDWQSSIGFQRQVGPDMSVEADYVYTRGRDEKVLQDNANLTFDPATGAPYPFSNRARRAFPEWGVVGQQMFTGWSNYHGLQCVFTKRFSHKWQGSLTYPLSGLRDGDPAPLSGINRLPNASSNLAYAPRTIQLGFRLTF
jgi:hypothetical protein